MSHLTYPLPHFFATKLAEVTLQPFTGKETTGQIRERRKLIATQTAGEAQLAKVGAEVARETATRVRKLRGEVDRKLYMIRARAGQLDRLSRKVQGVVNQYPDLLGPEGYVEELQGLQQAVTEILGSAATLTGGGEEALTQHVVALTNAEWSVNQAYREGLMLTNRLNSQLRQIKEIVAKRRELEGAKRREEEAKRQAQEQTRRAAQAQAAVQADAEAEARINPLVAFIQRMRAARMRRMRGLYS